MLSPEIKEVYLGQADVQQVFSVPKIGNIAGCMVSDGKLRRNAGIRLLRDGVVIYTGKLSSLRRFKDDAKEVTKRYGSGNAQRTVLDGVGLRVDAAAFGSDYLSTQVTWSCPPCCCRR